jgi:hypothetical protein
VPPYIRETRVPAFGVYVADLTIPGLLDYLYSYYVTSAEQLDPVCATRSFLVAGDAEEVHGGRTTLVPAAKTRMRMRETRQQQSKSHFYTRGGGPVWSKS